VPSLETIAEAAVSLGLKPVHERSLRVPCDSNGLWLNGVSWSVTSNEGRTRARLWLGSTPAWLVSLRTFGLLLAGSIPLLARASLHPFNDAAKLVLVMACVALGPWGVVHGMAWRLGRKLFKRAEELKQPSA
jgi:hypothetical protein